MILVDSLLLLPFRGVLWCAREIQRAATEQQQGEAEEWRDQLRELYMLLETGRIGEAEFDAREAELLDRMERGGVAGERRLPEG